MFWNLFHSYLIEFQKLNIFGINKSMVVSC